MDPTIGLPYYPSEFSVAVSLNGVDFRGAAMVSFWYFNLSTVLIAAVRPSGGPAAGGTLVNVSGTNFIDFGGGVQGPKCRFGSAVVPATRLSLTQAQCRAPPRPPGSPERVPVFISLNGYTDERGLAGGQLNFRYSVDHTLTAVYPLGGPPRGQAIVTVSGTGFVDTSGVTDENCTLDDAILCDMYANSIGNGVRHILGTIDQNDANPGLACLFGEPGYAVPASIVSSTKLLCQTPPIEELRGLQPPGPWCAPGQPHCSDPAYAEHGTLAVPLRVTLNGNRSDAKGFIPWFVLAEEMPRLFYLTPWGGPSDGGTNVTIVGEGLLDLGKPLCIFGNIEVPAVAGGFDAPSIQMAPLVTTTLVHDSRSEQVVARQAGRRMSCTAPAGHEFGGHSVNVQVSLDGTNFRNVEGGFTYVERIALSVLMPHGGPLAGGYGVVMHGSQFPRLGGLLCDFDGKTVPASMSKQGQVRCLAPPATAAGTVAIRVSLNGDLGDALSVESRNFTYFDETAVKVTSLEPSVGVHIGHTRVTVWGNGFAVYGPWQHWASAAYCRFGDHDPVPVVALKLNETDESIIEGFVCHNTPHDLTGGQQTADVPVEVSLNGYFDQFSTGSAVTFQYQSLCYGRDTLAYYDSYPGAIIPVMTYLMRVHPELKKYDVDGNQYINQTEYQALRVAHDAEPDAQLQQALVRYARETCFDVSEPPTGMKIAADRDALGVPLDDGDQSGGVLWGAAPTAFE